MPESPSTTLLMPAAKGRSWPEVLLGFATGALGGAAENGLVSAPIIHGVLMGGLFGLGFSFLCGRRTSSPGAGLIWGLSAGLLLWFAMSVDLLLRSGSSEVMLSYSQARFPQLVGCLVCLGMPVGVALGIRGVLRTGQAQPRFSWGRAIVAGGLAGTISGLAFSGWEYAGG